MPRRDGQTALVTGAAGVIGAAVARRLHDEGAALLLVDRDERVHAAAEALGARAEAFVLDILDPAQWAPVVAGRSIGVLVHCAGHIPPPAPADELPDGEFERIVQINLVGTFVAYRAVLPALRRAGGGHVVNLASNVGKEGHPGQAAYSAAKAGVIGLTKALAKEVVGEGIQVNAITPTIIDGPSVAAFDDAYRADVLAKVPMGRFGTPEEVAAMVAFVCSGQASYTTGFCFDLSGGRAPY